MNYFETTTTTSHGARTFRVKGKHNVYFIRENVTCDAWSLAYECLDADGEAYGSYYYANKGGDRYIGWAQLIPNGCESLPFFNAAIDDKDSAVEAFTNRGRELNGGTFLGFTHSQAFSTPELAAEQIFSLESRAAKRKAKKAGRSIFGLCMYCGEEIPTTARNWKLCRDCEKADTPESDRPTAIVLEADRPATLSEILAKRAENSDTPTFDTLAAFVRYARDIVGDRFATEAEAVVLIEDRAHGWDVVKGYVANGWVRLADMSDDEADDIGVLRLSAQTLDKNCFACGGPVDLLEYGDYEIRENNHVVCCSEAYSGVTEKALAEHGAAPIANRDALPRIEKDPNGKFLVYDPAGKLAAEFHNEQLLRTVLTKVFGMSEFASIPFVELERPKLAQDPPPAAPHFASSESNINRLWRDRNRRDDEPKDGGPAIGWRG